MPQLIDLTGQTFGKWLVLAVDSSIPGPQRHWLCRCACGTERAVAGQSLRTGRSTGCGCADDLLGKTFGKWTVIGRRAGADRRTLWLCLCECGAQSEMQGSRLTRGGSKSCGCGASAAISRARTTHGKRNTGLYRTWSSMRSRCLNPKHPSYRNYGARGVHICDAWSTFEGFMRDMEPTWTEGLTLERINNDGHYEPGNCKWIALEEQPKNRRPSSEWRKPAKRGASNGASPKLL